MMKKCLQCKKTISLSCLRHIDIYFKFYGVIQEIVKNRYEITDNFLLKSNKPIRTTLKYYLIVNYIRKNIYTAAKSSSLK